MILGFTGGGGASGSGLTYIGTWDALTNNPFLASGVGTDGDYYIVSVAGTTNLDGITSWGIGDWAIFNGGTWQKINNSTGSGTVTSVGASGGTGISISGTNPITTSGIFTITNTAPDQVVSITDGTGISTTGTYPNFTITNTAPSSGGTVTSVELTSGTGISLSGTNPITSSGTINVTNTAPDQVVSLTDGTGISTTGTYPNFTITNTAPDQTVSLSNGTGITTSGTYPSFTITNSLPDQTVVLNNGTGISVSGSYPNFTITNTQPSSGGTVTSVGLTAGTGISLSGTNPITSSGNINVVNTAPDQVVALNNGTGISVSGTYPNFTITNTQPSSGGTVTSVGLSMPTAFSVASSPITGSGTIAVTGAGTSSQYVRGDGQLANFPTTGGGGSSLNYYLNGSVNQGTFGGNTYYQMSRTPINGAGTDFTINADGFIARFITDANEPAQLSVPGGNWNLEFYFSASSSGGSPTFYVNVYKYNGGFTLIGTNSTAPELISSGTTIDSYFTNVSIPTASLNITDRIAIDVYVVHSGRVITMHTEDSHISEVVTTFSTGLTALNGLTNQVQYFATGTSGADFNISSATSTHTFNLPNASATNRGALTTSDWTTFNDKVSTTRTISTNVPLSGGGDLSANRTLSIAQSNATTDGYLSGTDWTTFNSKIGGSGTSGFVTRFTGASTIGNSVIQDNGTNLGIGVAPNTPYKLRVSTSTASQYAIYGEGLGQGFSGVAGISNGVGAFQNIGVYGSSTNSTTLNVGVLGEVDNALSVNIGGQFSATSGSANYSLQLQDGSEASGKFLKSVTSDGKANWVNVTIQDTNLAVTTTGTSGLSTLVGNTINIPQYVGDSIFTQTYRGISINNNSTTVISDGGVVMSTSASTLAQTVSTTNFATKQIRLRYYASVVSGGRYTGTRGSALLWFLHGGFRYVCDFNISDTSYSAGCQQFYGLAAVTTDLNYGGVSGILVSTLTNIIGVGSETGDANLQVFHNDSGGTATKIDLGVNFPANRTAGAISTTVYSINLYNSPMSTSVLYKVVNNETGAIAQGTLSTDLPSTSTGLNFFASRCMSTTSVTNTGQFDLSKLGVYSLL